MGTGYEQYNNDPVKAVIFLRENRDRLHERLGRLTQGRMRGIEFYGSKEMGSEEELVFDQLESAQMELNFLFGMHDLNRRILNG